MSQTSACLQCGKTFDWRRKNGRDRKYCSRPCLYAGMRGTKRTQTKPALFDTATCDACGKDFIYRPTQTKRERRYCSRGCYTTHWPTITRGNPEIWPTGTCQNPSCGKQFTYRRGNTRKFCSHGCFLEIRRLEAEQRAAGRRAPATKPCIVCGGPIPYWPSTPSSRRFCSHQCAAEAPRLGIVAGSGQRKCEACGADYLPTSNRQRWCWTCSPDKHARTRLRRYGITEKQWNEMRARYDGKCWVCREWPAEVIEHCHDTGKLRGAACRSCNTGLHYVDRPGWIDAARAYLEEVS